MLHDKAIEIKRDNIDRYLSELAKAYRKSVGKQMPAEIILVGGAAVLLKYGFRGVTTDIDALIGAASAMDDAIRKVANSNEIPSNWINSDFSRTASYSPLLREHSEYYKTFANVLEVRTIEAEYLIAMKLMAGRQYKSDLSDVVGVLASHASDGAPLTLDKIKMAAIQLYGDWGAIPEASRHFVKNVLRYENLSELYPKIIADEEGTKKFLMAFEEENPGHMNHGNVEGVVNEIQEKENIRNLLKILRSNEVESNESISPKIENKGRIIPKEGVSNGCHGKWIDK